MSVYFVQPASSSIEPIKIGFTDNWDRRVVELERHPATFLRSSATSRVSNLQHQRSSRKLLACGGRLQEWGTELISKAESEQ